MSVNSQNLKIYSIIEQLEDIVEDSPRPKMGGASKRIVDALVLTDLLGDLKVTIPDDIRRANSVILQSDSMISNADEHARELVANAQQQADEILSAANASAAQVLEKANLEYERLVQEDEIYQEPQRRAQLLAMKAEFNANTVYENAKIYSDELLADLERFLGEYKQQVAVNRKDLNLRARQAQSAVRESSAAALNTAEDAPAPAAEAAPEQRPVAAQQQDDVQPPVAPQPPQFEQTEAPDDDFFDDEEDVGAGRGFLGGLFGRRKRAVEDEDFES